MIEVHDLPALEHQPALREAMHQQRFRAFKLRHGWDVASINGFEIDQFDRASANPIYLLARGRGGELLGSCRLLQMSGPNMLHEVFRKHTEDLDLPPDPGLWECKPAGAVVAAPGRIAIAVRMATAKIAEKVALSACARR